MPAEFREILELAGDKFDRRLGYFGQQPLVLFYYERRGGDVLWKDGHRCGFGLGTWRVLLKLLVPLAGRYRVQLGDLQRDATHGVLIDRTRGRAYFVERDRGEAFIRDYYGIPAGCGHCLRCPHRGSACPPPPLASPEPREPS